MSNSIFNEDNYLNGDKENLRLFAEDYQERQERWAQEKIRFANVLKNYQEFINIIAKIIKTLGLKNSLEYSMLIKVLIDNGFLSDKMDFVNKPPELSKEITSSFGTSIIVGRGCCRNYTRMQQDLFKQLDLPLFMYYCYEGMAFLSQAKNAEANHVVTLVTYENQVYGLDIYNGFRLFKFKDAFTLAEISTQTHYTLRYKPYFELIMGESSLPHIKNRIATFEKLSQSSFVNPFEWEEVIKYNTKRKIIELNEYCIPYEIHEATEELKKEIADEMHSLIK